MPQLRSLRPCILPYQERVLQSDQLEQKRAIAKLHQVALVISLGAKTKNLFIHLRPNSRLLEPVVLFDPCCLCA